MSTDGKSEESVETQTAAPVEAAGPVAQWLPAMTPALRRRLQMCHDHASKLMQTEKYDFGYASTLLSQCVANDPGNLPYWDVFFSNTHRMNKEKKGGSMFGGFGGAGGGIKAHVEKQEYVTAIKAGVDALNHNPWDVSALRAMAEALEKLGLNEAELKLLKHALDVSPKDIEVNRHCAKTLARVGQIDQAIACWHRVESANRDDPEAARAISNLTVQKQRGGAGLKDDAKKASNVAAAAAAAKPGAAVPHTKLGGAQPKPGAAPAVAAPAAPVADKRREIKLTPRQQLERLMMDRPADIENYIKLAEIMIEESRPSEAIAVLQRALEASGGDIQVRERLEDAQFERQKVQCAIAEKKAEVDGTPEAQEAAEKLRAELNRTELDLIFSRTQRYPQNKELRFDMANRLRKMGNYAEAIKYLDEIVGDEKWIGPASLEIGQCYQHLQQYEKAWGAYKIAIKSLFESGDKSPEAMELKKLALYRGGQLAIGLKKADRAVQFFERLVKLDPKYRDAAARLDKAKRLGHKG